MGELVEDRLALRLTQALPDDLPGNLGATNVFRTLGPGWGSLCLFLDMAKGALAVVLTSVVVGTYPEGQTLPLHLTGDMYRIIAALVAILGHSFSPFVGFKGGKGIATTFNNSAYCASGAAETTHASKLPIWLSRSTRRPSISVNI